MRKKKLESYKPEVIYVNARFLTQPRAGVQRFAFDLCTELYSNKKQVVFLSPKKISSGYHLNFPVKKIGFFSGVIWEQLELPLFLFFKRNFILLNLCNTAPLLIKHKIVTIHDLSFIKFSSSYNFFYALYYKFSVWLNVLSAVKVITVSETVKTEMINYYKLASDKVYVVNNYLSDSWINNRIPEDLFNVLQRRYNLEPGKYFLLVSMYNPLKNIEKVIELITTLDEYKLVVVGGYSSTFNKRTKKYLEKLNNDKIVLTGHVNDDMLLKVFYKNAFSFITLSNYESFCIPILEAISVDTPVIARDVGAIKELFGDYPYYIKLNNSKQLLKDVQNVVTHLKNSKEKDKNYLASILKNKYTLRNSFQQLEKLFP